MSEMDAEAPELSEEERSAAGAVAAQLGAPLRSAFADRLAAWKATWSRPELELSSDTRDYTQGPEFEAILDLGPEALPLAIEHLARAEDGFFLLAAVERWQQRDDLVATTAEHPLESQQSRARRAVREALRSG